MKGGLWARKFDYKNGETRVCNKCNEPFYTKKPIWRCSKCFNAEQKIIQTKLRKERGHKEPYPFSSANHEAGARFSKIRQELRKAWLEGPDAVKEHYTKQLKEAEELGIMKWIFDRRDDATIKSRTEKTKNQTQIEYPDTRGHYEY